MKAEGLVTLLIALTIVIVFQIRQVQRRAPASFEPASMPSNSLSAAAVPEEGNTAADRLHQKTRIASRMRSPSADAAAPLVLQIRSAIESADDDEMENVYTNLWPALVACDAVVAMQLVQGIEDSRLREELRRRLSHLWAANDSSGALEGLGRLADVEERSAALTDACLAIAQRNPAEALLGAQRLGLDREQSGLTENLLQQWAEIDLPAALAWARACPEAEQRTKAIARVAFTQSQRDPLNAARLLVAEVPPGPILTEAAISVLHQWAVREPSAAAEWASQFPEGSLRARALHELKGVQSHGLDSPMEE